MFSKSLFKQSFKANWKLFAVVSVVMMALVAQFVAMEEGVMPLTTDVFYGMMSIIIPAIYVLIVANNLVSHQVDDGSLAYVLSTSTKRKSVVFTQAVFMISSLFVNALLVTLTHIVLKATMGSNALSYLQILYLNIGNLFAVIALSGICFMLSCIFNRSKNTMSVAGGLTVFFILMSMLAMFGGLSPSMSALANFKYVTLFTLFDKVNILNSVSTWILEACILGVIGFATYLIGSICFTKKDLPL